MDLLIISKEQLISYAEKEFPPIIYVVRSKDVEQDIPSNTMIVNGLDFELLKEELENN